QPCGAREAVREAALAQRAGLEERLVTTSARTCAPPPPPSINSGGGSYRAGRIRAPECRAKDRRSRVEEFKYYQTISSRTIVITIRTERVGHAQELTQVAKRGSR